MIITANDDDSVRNAAIQGGAIAIFVKPFDNETFLAAVHQALALETWTLVLEASGFLSGAADRISCRTPDIEEVK